MIPTDIGPHPDAPDYYFPMGKPKSWNETDCGTLMVRQVGATADMLQEPAARIVRQNLPSGQEIYPCFMMEWEPTDEECYQLSVLLASGEKPRFRSLISGTGLPPSSLWIKGEDEV